MYSLLHEHYVKHIQCTHKYTYMPGFMYSFSLFEYRINAPEGIWFIDDGGRFLFFVLFTYLFVAVSHLIVFFTF